MPSRGHYEVCKNKGKPTGTTINALQRYFLSKLPIQPNIGSGPQTKKNVKAHSFRIGWASDAMFKGVLYGKIQEMGRWKSNAAKRYIRQVDINVSTLN